MYGESSHRSTHHTKRPLGANKALLSAELASFVARLACVPSSVLITGETGSGKNFVARCLHEYSDRAGNPLVHVDCASLPETLIEAELFGHERGAFTGADANRLGRFELAGSGTILLDEVAEMDVRSQRRLLHVLEEREFFRIGGDRPVRMRARVIAATNRDIRSLVARGEFRSDLYHRLAVTCLTVPPLRERKGELPALVRYQLAHLAQRFSRPAVRVTPDFLSRLQSYHWPGNIRELFNILEHALVRSEIDQTELRRSDLDGMIPDNKSLQSADLVKCELCGNVRHHLPARVDESATTGMDRETKQLAAVLQATGGNISRAARRLGIARSTLRYRIQRSQLDHLIPQD